jgi:hypothetical protein
MATLRLFLQDWQQKTMQSFGCIVFKSRMKSVAAEGQKCEMTRTLNRDSQLTLMMCAGSGNTAGKNLSALGNVTAQFCNILVVNGLDFVNAEAADLSAAFASTGTIIFISHEIILLSIKQIRPFC